MRKGFGNIAVGSKTVHFFIPSPTLNMMPHPKNTPIAVEDNALVLL
jgi:hypothetical protein